MLCHARLSALAAVVAVRLNQVSTSSHFCRLSACASACALFGTPEDSRSTSAIARAGSLRASAAQALDLAPVQYDEAGFRFALNQDAMATDKLAEGIRAFCADAVRLDQLLTA